MQAGEQAFRRGQRAIDVRDGLARVVRRETLARLALKLHLGTYLLLGHGEEESGGRTRQATLGSGKVVDLSAREFTLAEIFMTNPGQVLSHAFLSEEIWGYKNVNDATLLKGHVSSIRQKIRNAGGNEETIHTVHGVGYSFTPV